MLYLHYPSEDNYILQNKAHKKYTEAQIFNANNVQISKMLAIISNKISIKKHTCAN